MFLDYYTILEIQITATGDDIKLAFRQQALKWHPDKNIGKDTTLKMQQINEAYLILKDTEARERYDIEYNKHKDYVHHLFYQPKSENNSDFYYDNTNYEDKSYNINDDILSKWIANARKQAVDLAKQTIEDLKGMVTVATKEAKSEFSKQIVFYIISGFIILLIFLIVNAVRSTEGDNIQINSNAYKPETKKTADNIEKLVNVDSVKEINTTNLSDADYIDYTISGLGTIKVHKDFELQGDEYRDNINLYSKIGNNFTGDVLVFQQKGLNKFNKESFNQYFRFMIETYYDNSVNSEKFHRITEKKIATTEELKEWDIIRKANFYDEIKMLKEKGNIIQNLIKWNGTNIMEINGQPALKTSYLRQQDGKPIVNVDLFFIQNYDRIHFITCAYRVEDANELKPIFTKMLNSLKIKENAKRFEKIVEIQNNNKSKKNSILKSNWIKYENYQHNFSIYMPYTPLENKRIMNTVIEGKLPIYFFNCMKEMENGLYEGYLIGVTPFKRINSDSFNNDELNTFYRERINGALNNIHGELLLEEIIKYRNYEGRRFRVKHANGKLITTFKIYFIDNYLYMMQATCLIEKDFNDSIHYFLNSFELITK